VLTGEGGQWHRDPLQHSVSPRADFKLEQVFALGEGWGISHGGGLCPSLLC